MALFHDTQDAWLLLEDGTLYSGSSFGAVGTTIGEVVFTTGMVGYPQTLKDPCYYGQIVAQTFPLIGNYGFNQKDIEGPAPALQGYIVREWCEKPSNFRCKEDINSYMKRNNVIGIYDIDTRALTKKLREAGTMNGMITTEDPTARKEELLKEIAAYHITDAVKSVTVKAQETYQSEAENALRVAIVNYGCPEGVCESLVKAGCDVTVLPACATVEDIKALGVDGVLLSEGPGDPSEDGALAENMKGLLDTRIPVMGMGLGHQILAMANGARCEKLHHGHRGSNQPVICLETGRTLITTQNCGYTVCEDSLNTDICKVMYRNSNDKSCEGIEYLNAPAFSIQFYAEANGGPRDTAHLFDKFFAMMKQYREEK